MLDRIVVERRDLVLAHALGGEPGRNMRVAEPLDIGEDLVGAGPAHRAGGLKGISDQDQAGAAIAFVDIEVGGPNFHLA